MTMIKQNNVRCAVCGEENIVKVLCSTSSFGASDLDTRPAPLARYAFGMHIQQCTHCGYISSNIAAPTIVTTEMIDEVNKIDVSHLKNELTRKLYKRHIFEIKQGKYEAAFWSVLQAAWDCDDDNNEENAIECREAAIRVLDKYWDDINNVEETPVERKSLLDRILEKFLEKFIYSESEPSKKETLTIVAIDVLRRSGHFEEAKKHFSGMKFDDDLLQKIYDFSMQKIDEQDGLCYTVDDVRR